MIAMRFPSIYELIASTNEESMPFGKDAYV